MLTPLGLGRTTEQVYVLAVQSSRDLDVDDIAAELGLSENEVRAALDVLAENRLVAFKAESDRVCAIDPQVSLSTLLSEQEAELAEFHHRVNRTREAIEHFITEVGVSDRPDGTVDGVSQVLGLANVRRVMRDLNASCRAEMRSMVPVSPSRPGTMESAKELSRRTLERGVKIRTICADSIRNSGDVLKAHHDMVELGAKIRTLPSVPMRAVIVDGEVAVVALYAQRSAAGAYVLSNNTLVEALVELHKALWERAHPLTVARARRQGGINKQELEALKLWARGSTDATVGRQLGVSERTVRRISENLAEKLGSESRFQMAVRAIEAGWLDVEAV